MVAGDLDDEFAEVGFDGLDASGGEGLIEFGFLGDHRLGFDDELRVRSPGDVDDELIGFFGVGGEVDVASGFFDIVGELFEVEIEVVEAVGLDVAGEGAEGVRGGEVSGEDVAAVVPLFDDGVFVGVVEEFIEGGVVRVGFEVGVEHGEGRAADGFVRGMLKVGIGEEAGTGRIVRWGGGGGNVGFGDAHAGTCGN